MGTAFAITAPYTTAYQQVEDAPLQPDELRIRTLYSGISAGTELTYYRGTNPYLNKRWDAERRLFLPQTEPSVGYPVVGIGYEEVGEIIEVGSAVTGIRPGARLFGTWGHRTHHVASLEYVLPRLLPDELDPLCGIFSHLGAIALNGVFDAAVRLGETVAVFGMGALGQIVALLVQASGGTVIAVDLHDSRLALAKQHGSAHTINAGRENPAEAIKALTGGVGADVCIEVSGSAAALHEALRSVAYASKVVALGFFQGEAAGLFLGDEFHHNRVNLVCSQISGVAPELQHRWTKLRLWQTAIRLQHEGRLELRGVITHRRSFDRTHELFELLDQRPQDVVHAVIEF